MINTPISVENFFEMYDGFNFHMHSYQYEKKDKSSELIYVYDKNVRSKEIHEYCDKYLFLVGARYIPLCFGKINKNFTIKNLLFYTKQIPFYELTDYCSKPHNPNELYQYLFELNIDSEFFVDCITK